MPVDVARLTIVHHPASVLRRKAQPLPAGPASAEVRAVARRMLELMHQAPGVGLAAPQVGLSWRLFVANHLGFDHPDADRVFINPVLADPSPDTDDREEGCLSIPGVHVTLRRPSRITITAQDLDGNPVTLTADDLQSRIWQHETDHLDGVLIIDRMTAMDRMANRRALQELEAGR